MTYYVAKLSKTAQLPVRAHEGDAGLDLISDTDITIPSHEWRLISTHISGSMEPYHVGLVCPRSGLALRHGVTVLNSPGIIDAPYRGSVDVILINHGAIEFPVVRGMRVAQLVILPATNDQRVVEVDRLPVSVRNSDGFGSTGL